MCLTLSLARVRVPINIEVLPPDLEDMSGVFWINEVEKGLGRASDQKLAMVIAGFLAFATIELLLVLLSLLGINKSTSITQ